MKKITLEISKILDNKIDAAVLNEGFHSRSEFLRFLLVTYFNKNPFAPDTEPADEEKDEKKLIFGRPEEDFEFGIPPDVIEKIKEEARKLPENGRRPLS